MKLLTTLTAVIFSLAILAPFRAYTCGGVALEQSSLQMEKYHHTRSFKLLLEIRRTPSLSAINLTKIPSLLTSNLNR